MEALTGSDRQAGSSFPQVINVTPKEVGPVCH